MNEVHASGGIKQKSRRVDRASLTTEPTTTSGASAPRKQKANAGEARPERSSYKPGIKSTTEASGASRRSHPLTPQNRIPRKNRPWIPLHRTKQLPVWPNANRDRLHAVGQSIPLPGRSVEHVPRQFYVGPRVRLRQQLDASGDPLRDLDCVVVTAVCQPEASSAISNLSRKNSLV